VELKIIAHDFSICKVNDIASVDLNDAFCFLSKTDEEISVVCISENVPPDAIQRDDGWKAFRIQGVLDFSLIGVLSELSALLAKNKISVFAVSTYNTDYIFTKAEDFARALAALAAAGHRIADA
jgi:hypothetical protein